VREQLDSLELCLGMDEEPPESLWVGACCRSPDQEEQVNKALCRQIGAASLSQALVLLGEFKSWRDSTAGKYKSRRFLE